MSIDSILTALHDSTLGGIVGGDILGTEFVFPAIETVHVLALGVVYGSILLVDLRLLGIGAKVGSASKVSSELLPWTWRAFAVAAVAGLLMFVSKAPDYWYSPQFRIKFLAMGLAGVNMLAFHMGAFRRINEWDQSVPPPAAARLAGGLSILLWTTIVVMGRWVGFVT